MIRGSTPARPRPRHPRRAGGVRFAQPGRAKPAFQPGLLLGRPAVGLGQRAVRLAPHRLRHLLQAAGPPPSWTSCDWRHGFEFCAEVTAKVLRRACRLSRFPSAIIPAASPKGRKIRARDGIIAAWTFLRLVSPAPPRAVQGLTALSRRRARVKIRSGF